MDDKLESNPIESGTNMKIWVIIGIIISLIIGFSVGYFIKSDSSSEINELQNQIDTLNTQNSQLQQQIDELQSEDYFEYTHSDGEKYMVSVSEYNFPLSNASKCNLMNKIWLKYYSGKDYLVCSNCGEDFREHDVKDVNLNYLYTISSCNNVGFIIDEEGKTITFKSVTSPT